MKGTTATASGVEAKLPEIQREMNVLDEAINNLEDASGAMIERVAAILSTPDPTPETAQGDDSVTALASRIKSFRVRVSNITADLRDARARVEL